MKIREYRQINALEEELQLAEKECDRLRTENERLRGAMKNGAKLKCLACSSGYEAERHLRTKQWTHKLAADLYVLCQAPYIHDALAQEKNDEA